MRVHILLVLLLIATSVLASVHIIALELSLYYIVPYLDIPMHFLGGVIVTLMVTSFVAIELPIPKKLAQFPYVIGAVLIVGLSWEIFEILAGIGIEANYLADTSLDIVMDTIGGAFGYYMAKHLASL